MNNIFRNLLSTLVFFTFSSVVTADDVKKELQDMSDPLAVYTQAGIGYTDRGFNIKVGGAYDSGKPATMAMNIIEIQGLLGEKIGFRDGATDKIDSIRFRNFTINTKNGLGSQVDISYNLNSKTGSASYALIQALPKLSIIQLYPLAGVGLNIANNVNENLLWKDADSPSGISIPGAFATFGMYSKVTITKDFWFNYNPIWMTSIAGAKNYENNTYAVNESSILTHEVALSYQITPVMNIRYFGNWSNLVDFKDGGHRLEFNYQL